MTRIHWTGDYSNDPMTGTVVAKSGDLLTIKWDNGTQMVVPELVTRGRGWSFL